MKSNFLFLTALTVIITALNCIKPLVVDDTAYLEFARHIAQHPTDPYGFRFWGTVPGFDVLSPLVVPYWWAGVLRLGGEHVWVWKLALLPFVVVFVTSTFALACHFCRGLERVTTLTLVLSPPLLPSWNLMLDLPALALSLAALAVFLAAVERRSAWHALAAGVLLGLAMQTKYTAFTIPFVVVLFALVRREYRLGVTTAGIAVLLFASWELWMQQIYGHSHFTYHVGRQAGSPWRKLRLALPLVTTVGGTAPWLALLGLAAVGAGRRLRIAYVGWVVLIFALLIALPASWHVLTRSPDGKDRLRLSSLFFSLTGLAVTTVGAIVIHRLFATRQPIGEVDTTEATQDRAIDWLLVAWVGVEVLGYFALSPFPAARRILGLVTAATFLTGRVAARTLRDDAGRAWVQLAAAMSVVLGIGFAGIDVLGAAAERTGAELAAWRIAQQHDGGRVWLLGGYGFNFYAKAEGMLQVCEATEVRPGDWLVSDGVFDDRLLSLVGHTEPWDECTVGDSIPLTTLYCFYSEGMPMDHHEGPRFRVRIYRKPRAGNVSF